MEIIGIGANLVLVTVSLYITMTLWGAAQGHLSASGGWSELIQVRDSLAAGDTQTASAYFWMLVTAPGFGSRIASWAMAWGCGVFAIGGALVSIAGLHWCWHRCKRILA